MALTDENTTTQQPVETQQRPSGLQQYIAKHGTEGLNQNYVNYTLANGGGFGATAAGVVKDTEGNLHPIYDFNRSKEEIAYAKALKRGENLDTWYAKAKDESDAAAENYKALSDKLASLNAANDRMLTASPFAVATYQNAPSKEEISHLEEAVKQAEKDQQRKSDDFAAAKAYKDYRDTTRPVDEAAERGVSYKDQYDAYSQSLDRLNAEKQKLLNDHAFSKIGGQLNENGEVERAPAGKADEDNDRLEKLTREIERLEGQRAYAENFLTKDAGAKQIIKQGEELARIAHANKQQNEINALEENDSDAGFRAAVAFRQAERSGLSPDDRWTQEQKDLYHYYWGAYGQDAAEGFAERVNRYLNGEEAAAGNGVLPGTEIVQQWAERGGKWATAGKALVALAGKLGVNNLVYNAASYIDRMLNVAATGRDAGRSFALPNEIVDAAYSTVANKLNETQIVGGKGLGDLYQLGTSMAQSLVYGNGLGKIGTLGAFFFQAANSSYDEAMQRGASAQYAAAYSTLCGISEGAWETFSFDKLIKGDWTNHFFRTLVSQGFIEGSEEVNTSLFNKYAETLAARLTNEQSMVEREISSLVANGMSRKDAEHQIWTQFAKDVAWDFAGGYISGFGSSAIQSGVNATQNKLWDMRKDAVLGKENAEGQREGGKKNASNDELSKMFDRALKRGDIRGAEQILQVIEQRGATAEEQEYGPVDPTANERMRRKLERQLNGERVSPQTENAEIVTESATNRQLAEEARVQAEFPTISPITMELVRRLDGKDFVTMAKSMTTQELAEVARYARYIGENAKADLLEKIRLDPTYRYEEQTPAHTDEDDLLQNGPQNVAGQQAAPAGQITQPIQQNAAQTVKPVDSERQGHIPTWEEYKAQNNIFLQTGMKSEKQLRADYERMLKSASTTSTESGTIPVPNTQEVTTNAGEQAVRTGETAEESERGGRYTGASRDDGLSRILPAESGNRAGENAEAGSGKIPQKSAGEQRTVTVGEDGTEYESTFDGESVQSIVTNGANKEVKNGRTVTNGTRIVKNPAKSSKYYPVWALAKSFGESDNIIILDNETGPCIATDGIPESKLNGFHSGDKIVILFNGNDIKNIPARFRQYFNLSKTFIHEYTHKQLKKLAHSTGVKLLDSWDYYNSIKSIASKALDKAGFDAEFVNALADKFLDNGYSKTYDRAGIWQAFLAGYDLGLFGKNIPRENFVREVYRMMASEEIITCFVSQDINAHILADKYGITADKLSAISSAIAYELNSQNVYDDNVEAAINNFDTVISSNDSKTITSDDDLGRAVKKAASGNVRQMEDAELLAVLNYALDRSSPTSKSKPLSERVSDLYIEYGNSATSYISETNDYFGRHVGKMSEGKTDNLMRTVDAVLRELERRGVNIDSGTSIDSGIGNYENNFGIATRYGEKGAPWDTLTRDDGKGNVSYAVSKRGRQLVELDQEYKPLHDEEVDRRKRDDFNVRSREAAKVKTDDEIEEEFDAKRKPAIMRSLEKGNDIVESFGTNQPNGTRRRDVPVNPAKTTQKYQGRDIEDTGWIKPVETSAKEVKQARDAVEAKGKEAQLKDKLKTLEAQRKYLEAVAKGMHDARSKLYGSEDIEQRKADLGYIADNLNEQLEQLDADLGYVADGVIGTEEEAAIDNILAQKERANAQLNALRDEYKHIEADDSASLRNVRSQIDSVISEISALSRQLDGVSKRADAADWGSNKRTLFQAEMAENPARETGSEHVEPNVYGPYTSPKNRALNGVFRQQVEAELEADQMRITDEDDSTDISEPTRGMGTGYVGMQRSRNKDGSIEFRTMYDDALPTRPATDKTRKPLNAPSTAYSNVAQAARSILNSKNSFLDFSKDRPKDIPSKVTNTMGQLREHVREMMEGDHPVNALMQLSNMVHEFENDDDLKVFSSDSIKKSVDELNDIYYNQDITNEEKARRMVENATKTLTLISKRIQLVDRGYNMLKTFTSPKKKRDNTTFWSKYKAMQLNPSTLFKAMDGFARDKNGSGYQIAKMIENGTALYTITQAQALKKLSDVSGLEGFKEFAEGNAKPFDIDGVKITEQQAVEFIMQVRNLQNTSVTGKDGPTTRLNTIDGFSIKDKDGNNTFIERSDDADGTNADWFLNLAEAMENSLSPAAKKYLETATEILDDLGQQASDIRTNLIGTGFDNSINGTYYPINYDNKNGTAESQQNKPTSLFSGPMYQSRTRNVGGYVSIKNASDTMDRYIHWASNAIGYGEVAELLYAMDNTGSRMQNLSSLANDTLGQGYSEYIAKYIKDINEIPDGQKNDKSAFAVLRRNMAAGALLGNLGVAAKQAASLWSAAGVLSPQALLSAETYFGGHSGAGNMILQSRKTGTSLDPTISEILHNDSFMGKLMKRSGVSEFMGKATAFVDYQTVKRLFAATVVDTKLSFPGLDQNSELFAQTVEAKFQDVVLQTQPIFVKNARAGYLRANDELTKALAMFRTQPTQNLNSIVTAMGEYRALKGTEFGKAAGKKLRNTIIGQTASAVTFATLSAIVSFARHGLKKFRDDDDEISWAEVAKRIGLDSLESLAGIFVVGGDIAKAIIDMATGGDTKEFYDMNAGVFTMLFDTVSSVTTFGTNVVKAIKDDKPLAVFNAGRQAADNLLQLGGIPANTVYRLLNSITMYSADALRTLSGGKLGNRAEYDDALKMLDSYIRGDLTGEGAKAQAAKAFRKDQPENLLYNLGILSSLTSKDSKVDKGADWLNTRIQGKTEEEREAYKEDELARLGRNLNSGERIANYLADSALSAAQKDEAISKFATTSGYNVLYESLRAAGMTPKAAVEELGKTDNKTGLSTDIRDDDSLADLYAGKDNPGETNDVPALDKKNTDEYVNFVSAMKVFKETGNYSQLDKLVDQYSKLDANTRAVIDAKDSAMKNYLEYRAMGLSTKDYYNVKDAIKQAQIDLDLAANTGTVVKLVGLSKTNLTKAQVNKLINSDTLGISKTGKSLISVLSKYGYTIGDIGMFMYNTDWTNDDANGTLSQQEVVLALAKEKRLTDAQRSAIYEELKPLLRNEYKINHWYDKSYEYELNYLLQSGKTSGRAS